MRKEGEQANESDAAQEERPVVFYDFLYKDESRIASYYAQIFNGKLTNLEESDIETDSNEKSAKGSVKVAEGQIKYTSGVQSGSKRNIDPHDLLATDVLSYILDSRGTYNYLTADHNRLVLVKGTLSLIDHNILALSMSAFEHEVKEKRRLARNQTQKLEVRNAELILQIVQKVQMPSAFMLETEDGVKVAGTIKESGMTDLISTYHFKYGAAGVGTVFIVGIKEIPHPVEPQPVEQLFGAAQQIASGFSQALFPPDSVLVTPLAIFRLI